MAVIWLSTKSPGLQKTLWEYLCKIIDGYISYCSRLEHWTEVYF